MTIQTPPQKSRFSALFILRNWVIALLVTGGLTAVSLYYSSTQFIDLIHKAFSSPMMIVIVLAMIANQAFGTMRLLISVKQPWNRYTIVNGLTLNFLHQVAARLLPARLSEVVWAIFVTHRFNLSVPQTLGQLVGLRVLDVLGLIGIGMSFVIWQQTHWGLSGKLSALAGLIVCLALPIILVRIKLSSWLLELFAKRLGQNDHWMTWFIGQLIHFSRQVELALSRHLWQQIILVCMSWSIGIGTLSLLILAMGLEIELLTLVPLMVIYTLTSAIPIPSLGVFGSAEFGLASTLILTGISSQNAFATSLALGVSHTLLSLGTAGMWFVFLFAVQALSPQSTKTNPDNSRRRIHWR